MKKFIIFLCIAPLLFLMYGCHGKNSLKQDQFSEAEKGRKTHFSKENTDSEKEKPIKIQVRTGELVIVYTLNNSQAAKDLYAQLPLTLEVQNFGSNEKIFYPPKELDISNTPLANAEKGSLCYYAPWADVVLFYGQFQANSDLYTLGEVVSGEEDIQKLSGSITVTAID
ncbi:cyclophilin-like fold protein [Massiliimalia timonensis]|nr:cyclophilin-like fold protein [Massiliimalia timonensis]